MAYGIAAAVNSGLFETVIVSSEDPEMGQIAEHYGAEFLRRPEAIATDKAASIDAVLHAIDTLTQRGIEPENICQLFPNCPLVTRQDVTATHEIFCEAERLFQISVVKYRCVHPEWAMICDADHRGEWLFGKRYLVRSQELSRTFCPTGAVWWASRVALLKQKTFYGIPFHLAEIDANRGVDIDDLEDLRMADLLVRGLTARDGVSPLEPLGASYFQRG